ncbi:hypothetical protein AgCh_008662 [Apium graveolens]
MNSVETENCGWGVEAAEFVSKGDFIIEQLDGETRIGIFAARSIEAGEPLTYDYKMIKIITAYTEAYKLWSLISMSRSSYSNTCFLLSM